MRQAYINWRRRLVLFNTFTWIYMSLRSEASRAGIPE